MQLSEARIEANRQNALKSSGPKTPEGKRHSRANALKHGLCSEVVGLEEPHAVLARAVLLDPTHGPVDDFQGWAAGQVAVLSLRIERCQASERAIRDRIVARAEVTWDEDRRLEAIVLGQALSRRPEDVSARLRETYHGCEWLLGRWAMLAYSAEIQGGWTPGQANLAVDLLGTPLESRDGCPPGDAVDARGTLIDPTGGELALARFQIDALRERLEVLRPIDEAAREHAEADLAADSDPEMRRLRRYEAELYRRLKWSLGLLQAPTIPSPPPPAPEPEARSEPESGAPPVAIRPSAAVAPVSGSNLPSPPAPPSRVERRLNKAESRREARRRKLDGRRD